MVVLWLQIHVQIGSCYNYFCCCGYLCYDSWYQAGTSVYSTLETKLFEWNCDLQRHVQMITGLISLNETLVFHSQTVERMLEVCIMI